jgi:hypothetical protein
VPLHDNQDGINCQSESSLIEAIENRRKKLANRVEKVSKMLAKCKKYIAEILIQVITLYYDDSFANLYQVMGYKKGYRGSQKETTDECKHTPGLDCLNNNQVQWDEFLEEDDLNSNDILGFLNKEAPDIDKVADKLESRMLQRIKETFPFHLPKFNEEVLDIIMGYLFDTTKLGVHYVTSAESIKAGDKVFHYVTTIKNDCFINSLKGITASDIIHTHLHFDEDQELKKRASEIRYSLITIIDHIATSGFDRRGTNLKLLSERFMGEGVKATPGQRDSGIQRSKNKNHSYFGKFRNWFAKPENEDPHADCQESVPRHSSSTPKVAFVLPRLNDCNSIFGMIGSISKEINSTIEANLKFKYI